MNLFSRFKEWLMNRIDPKKLEKTFGVKIASSLDMQDLIEQWLAIYQGTPSWVGENKEQVCHSLNVASTIVSDLATKCLSELSIGENIAQDTEKFWKDEIKDEIHQQLEYALASGSFIARPYYDDSLKRVAISWYTADRFVPIDWVGRKCVAGIFIDQDVVNDANKEKTYYTKLECHKWKYRPDGQLADITVSVKLFKSTTANDISNEIPLSAYPKWANITPEFTVTNVTEPLFVYAGMPFANNKALNSKAGVSLYKDGVAILEQIDRIYDNLNWEIESTQHKIFADVQLLETERKTNGDIVPRLDNKEKRLFKVMDANGAGNRLFDEYSPAIRQADITATLKTNMSLLCNCIHLDSGAYVYDENKQAVTAREITSKEQKTYQTITGIQNWCIKPALERLFACVEQMSKVMYGSSLDLNNLEIKFGDSILIDEQTNRENAQREVELKLRSKVNYLMEYRGLTEEEAQLELQRIEAETPKTIDFFAEGV